MIISFLNMNDECSGCFFVISKQNLLTSDIDLCFFMCERVDRLRGARRAFHQFLCKYRSTSMYIYLHVYANIFVQIYIYLHVSLPPCICKYICANIYLPPCLFSPMYMQIYMCKYRSTSMYIYLHVYAELLLTIFPNVPKVTRLQKLRCFFKFSKKSKVTRF